VKLGKQAIERISPKYTGVIFRKSGLGIENIILGLLAFVLAGIIWLITKLIDYDIKRLNDKKGLLLM